MSTQEAVEGVFSEVRPVGTGHERYSPHDVEGCSASSTCMKFPELRMLGIFGKPTDFSTAGRSSPS